MFFYADGQAVCKGDIVNVFFGSSGGVAAFVEDVFLPNTKGAEDFSCKESGGVLIRETGEAKAFGLLVDSPADGKLDEDYVLVRRAN
jgi:hypothetical protein